MFTANKWSYVITEDVNENTGRVTSTATEENTALIHICLIRTRREVFYITGCDLTLPVEGGKGSVFQDIFIFSLFELNQ